MADIDTVKVAVRIRPFVQTELNGCQSIINKINGTQQIVIKNNDSYTFNYVFEPDDNQEILYNVAVKEMLPKLMEGYNVTILAYGQTGSGKTHTMGTAFNGIKNSEMGVIPRVMYDIFDRLTDISVHHQFRVTCSFMEIYQEQLYDMLSTNSREQSIVDIREDSNKGIIIPGLTEYTVTSATEVIDCLIKGSSGRAVGVTAMNQQSSRSHAIFTVTIQMMKNNEPNTSTTSKFHLVDLAGSERSKKTKTTGDRFKEGVKINQGLLALGNVISALGTGQGNGYIGYRDSKLTRLLQDSLGGNSVTLMIACISSSDCNLDETLSTLRYADRARKIKNKPIVNQDPKTVEINRLWAIIQKLRLKLDGNDSTVVQSVTSNHNMVNMRKELNLLYDNNCNLQQQLQDTLQEVAELEIRVVVSENAYNQLQNKFQEFSILINNLKNDLNKENYSPESIEFAKKIDNMRNFIDEIDGIIRANKQELYRYTFSGKTNYNTQELDPLKSVTEDVPQTLNEFTTKEIDFSNELRRIDGELNLKEEHQLKVTGNLLKFSVYEGDNIEDIKMKILENEKIELLEKLKCIKELNASAKIAEERRKRLQQLEVEVNELKKTNLKQSKLLRLHEKESQKIINLNSEIQLMKASKVKLIHQLKVENDKSRQLKLNREKQLKQLKVKDKKRQSDMVRMESLHNKQKNVLKRKIEEAVAVNKKLKEALDKQKTAQIMKKANCVHLEKVDESLAPVEHEAEAVMSVKNDQYALSQLKNHDPINNHTNTSRQLGSEKLTEVLEIRNVQVDDVHNIYSPIIKRKMKIICNGVQGMPESKVVSDFLRKYGAKDYKIYEIKASYDVADEKLQILQKMNKSRKEIANVEKNYENKNKITLLIRELNNVPQQIYDEVTPQTIIQQVPLHKLNSIREELSKYKRKCAEGIIEIKRDNNSQFQVNNPILKAIMSSTVGQQSSLNNLCNNKRLVPSKRSFDGIILYNHSKQTCNTSGRKCRTNNMFCSEKCVYNKSFSNTELFIQSRK